MFERMANGWELAKESFEVLKLDKELLLFPLVSGFSCLLVLASFALPLWNSDYLKVIAEDGQIPNDPLAYIILFAFYFVNYFIIIFFNSALVACAVIRFRGGDPSVSDGLRAACMRLPQILGWAAVSATVGMILKVIESRSKRVGQIVSALLGMAWTVTTYFVIPVLVVESANPAQAMKRSVSILKKTWGEALAANFGIGFIAFLLNLPAFLLLVLGIFALVSGNMVAGSIGVAAAIFWILLVTLISTTLDAILLAALYLYAAEGEIPSYFNSSLMKHAFARR